MVASGVVFKSSNAQATDWPHGNVVHKVQGQSYIFPYMYPDMNLIRVMRQDLQVLTAQEFRHMHACLVRRLLQSTEPCFHMHCVRYSMLLSSAVPTLIPMDHFLSTCQYLMLSTDRMVTKIKNSVKMFGPPGIAALFINVNIDINMNILLHCA